MWDVFRVVGLDLVPRLGSIAYDQKEECHEDSPRRRDRDLADAFRCARR